MKQRIDPLLFDLARKTRAFSDLAFAAVNGRLSDRSRLDRALVETRDLMDAFRREHGVDGRAE